MSFVVAIAIAIAFAATYAIQTSPYLLSLVSTALACAFGTGSVLYRFTSRRIRTRI